MKGFKGRALFNLLRLKYRNQQLPTSLEQWQIEDYRAMNTEALFHRLLFLGVSLDLEAFKLYTASCDSPEKLLYYLSAKEENDSSKLQIYLIVFELWRRFVPEKQSLSILTDEIDHKIEQHYQGELEEDQAQVMFVTLEDIFDQAVDEGQPPKGVFVALSNYMAHNLEHFLYDYIGKMIAQNKDLTASELIDGFYPYIQQETAFDLLKVKLLAKADVEEATIAAQRLSEKIIEEKNKSLAFDLIQFLAQEGTPEVFFQTYQKIVPLIETEKDFKQMLEIAASYYRGFDKELEEEQIQHLINSRKDIDPNRKIEIKELILKAFNK
ncbi:MAG: hypothetical protein HY860_04145 [Chlamydiales bacterium]|nr:hypothetical protein [Chlamydiales bacterium]